MQTYYYELSLLLKKFDYKLYNHKQKRLFLFLVNKLRIKYNLDCFSDFKDIKFKSFKVASKKKDFVKSQLKLFYALLPKKYYKKSNKSKRQLNKQVIQKEYSDKMIERGHLNAWSSDIISHNISMYILSCTKRERANQ